MTCCTCTESAMTLGRFASSSVRIEIEYACASLRSRAMISRMTSFMSTNCRFESPFLDIDTDAVDNVCRALCVSNDSQRSLTRLSQIGIISRKPPYAGAGAGEQRR